MFQFYSIRNSEMLHPSSIFFPINNSAGAKVQIIIGLAECRLQTKFTSLPRFHNFIPLLASSQPPAFVQFYGKLGALLSHFFDVIGGENQYDLVGNQAAVFGIDGAEIAF